MSSLREAYQQLVAELDAKHAAALARNARLFELARHNGYRPRIVDNGGLRTFEVPPQLVAIAGYQVAVLP